MQRESAAASGSTDISDEALIEAIADKAVWAMEMLYERYHRMLYAFVYHIVADHQVAEDLLQEALFSVWQRAASYSALNGSVRSWLISIVHHRAIDHLRRLQRRATLSQVPLEQIASIEGLASSDVWDAAWQSVKRDLIREALANLPPEQRMVIELAYFQGWTHSEIAEGCRLPLGTVKARMRLGLLHLKRLLEKKDLRESGQ
ncbi:MAG: RNA polymerase sigma factor [Ktedonobacteraceae bacterium]|nr:RNA polymerase sigma factor [Ktedonobacteraceae bacterium]